jgi:hypothetical protein
MGLASRSGACQLSATGAANAGFFVRAEPDKFQRVVGQRPADCLCIIS